MISLWFTMLCYRFSSLFHGVGLVRLWLTCLFLWLRLAAFPGSAHTPRRIPPCRNAGHSVAHTPAHRLHFYRQFGAHTPAQTHTNRFYSFWAVFCFSFVFVFVVVLSFLFVLVLFVCIILIISLKNMCFMDLFIHLIIV